MTVAVSVCSFLRDKHFLIFCNCFFFQFYLCCNCLSTIKIKSFLVVDFFFLFLNFQYAIKLATKLNEKRLSSITELTTLEDKPITILDTGQRDKDRDKDNRDRERDWTYQKQNHIANNHHQQSVVNHSTNVSVAFPLLDFRLTFCASHFALPFS